MYLRNLSPCETSDYILWKATKKLKQLQQTSFPIMKQNGYKIWLTADTFVEYLVRVFTFNAREVGPREKKAVFGCWESTNQLVESQTTKTTKLTKGELKAAFFKHLNAKKAPGYNQSNLEETTRIRFKLRYSFICHIESRLLLIVMESGSNNHDSKTK